MSDQTAQDVPQDVEELVAAVAAEAQPQIEAMSTPPSGAAAGIPNPFRLPGVSSLVRTIALEVVRSAAETAGQNLKDFVAGHRDELLAKLPGGLVTLLSGLPGLLASLNLTPAETPPWPGRVS